MEYLVIFARIISIMSLLLFCALIIMGKRPIGEMPVFDFLSIIVLASIVGADIADPDIKHLPTAFAVVVMAVFQRIIAELAIRKRWFKRLINFEPTVILKDGVFICNNIKKIKYSIDEVLMLLRDKDIFDIGKLSFAIIESNGKLSILKKSENEVITLKDSKIEPSENNNFNTIILEGKLQFDNLSLLNKSEQDIIKIINSRGYNCFKDIFYASMNKDESINISPYKSII